MKLGLHLCDFTQSAGPARLGPVLAEVAAAADDAGFDRISVMDHLWQIDFLGPPENEMLEAYTTLGFLAGHTKRAKLMTLVTGVVYREPGLLAKAVSTLDVLSGGRAILGIGAAWNEQESKGLGLPFPPTAERFERLEEALRICRAMFDDTGAAFEGEHYKLDRMLNRPVPLSRPRPPILVGGGGEKKTLRLVAQYADSCNLFAGPDLAHKLDVLKRHCDDVGRDYDEIEKTVMVPLLVGQKGELIGQTLDTLREMAALGFTVGHGGTEDMYDLKLYELIKNELVPAAAEL